MQILGLMLVVINVLSIVGPVAGLAVVYGDRLVEVVVPPEVAQVFNSTFSVGQVGPLLSVAGAQSDNISRTLVLTLDVSNPLNCSLTLKAFDADVQCAGHQFLLGEVCLVGVEVVPALGSASVVVDCVWTVDGEGHFVAKHGGEGSVDLLLVNVELNFNDVTVELSEPIEVPDVPVA